MIAAHNEGDNLWRTVQSTIASTAGIEYDILVADDASTDSSVAELLKRCPDVTVVSHETRRGVSTTKDMGGRTARGEVLVFLDAHCKPQNGAIAHLVSRVRELECKSIVVPAVPALNCDTWENNMGQVGNGYICGLVDFECRWINCQEMRRCGLLYESPALMGCCVAVGRQLYEELWGFDTGMREWGQEDLDFGLKAWLTGHHIYHDPRAVIGHRFQRAFTRFTVTSESVLANQLRMARKNFTDNVWLDWMKRCRERQSTDVWDRAWAVFEQGRESLENERDHLFALRVRDEFMFAIQFGLAWPVNA